MNWTLKGKCTIDSQTRKRSAIGQLIQMFTFTTAYNQHGREVIIYHTIHSLGFMKSNAHTVKGATNPQEATFRIVKNYRFFNKDAAVIL